MSWSPPSPTNVHLLGWGSSLPAQVLPSRQGHSNSLPGGCQISCLPSHSPPPPSAKLSQQLCAALVKRVGQAVDEGRPHPMAAPVSATQAGVLEGARLGPQGRVGLPSPTPSLLTVAAHSCQVVAAGSALPQSELMWGEWNGVPQLVCLAQLSSPQIPQPG